MKRIVIAACLAMALPFPSLADEPALRGTVRDEAGSALAGVVVRLSTRSNGARITETDSQGHYAFWELDPGTYPVSFERAGFVSIVRRMEVSYAERESDPKNRDVTMVRESKIP
jgi:hypothetical protein